MNVIFFDGYCGLCNGFIDFVMKIDKKDIFRFSPLQSDYAKTHLNSDDVNDLKSIVVLIDGVTYRKAPAVLQVLKKMGGIWKAASVFNLLPNTFLNGAYDLTASNRYRIFGKSDTCRLPTPEERAKFIL